MMLIRFFLTTLFVLIWLGACAQSCSAPGRLTDTQRASVKGQWQGHYELDGTRTEFKVSIGEEGNASFASLTSPPIPGDPEKEIERFCGAGAFHFRKEFANGYFEFDGVPAANEMKGSLKVESGGKKSEGSFVLARIQ